MFRSRAERKVEEAGYDPARPPPGRVPDREVAGAPRGRRAGLSGDLAGWDFRVYGEVDEPLTLGWEELDALPKETVVEDIHCVTRWCRFDAE